MRAAPAIFLAGAMALSACAAVNAAANDQSYALESGVATYDALQRAGAVCKARGGTIKAPTTGNIRMLSNYTCSIPAGAKPQ